MNKPLRYLVGTGLSVAVTDHRLLSAVARRVNRLVYLGYTQILIEDQLSGWKCLADDVVTVKQLDKALHTEERAYTRLPGRRRGKDLKPRKRRSKGQI